MTDPGPGGEPPGAPEGEPVQPPGDAATASSGWGETRYGDWRPPPTSGPPPTRRRRPSPRLIWTVVAAVVVLALISRHNITQLEVIIFCVLVPSLVVHEVAHGWVALACGDDTARRAGRLSLNPVRHVDVVGTLIVPAVTVLAGWGFLGWAKPVPVDLSKLRSPRNQGVLVALAGPGINVVVAVLAGVAFRVLFSHGSGNLGLAAQVVFYLSLLNLWVACFNLVPLPPLDGSVLVERLLPAAWWPGYLRIRPYTLPVLFGAILLLSWANVYPLGAVFNHLQDWWAQQLGVTLTSAPVS